MPEVDVKVEDGQVIVTRHNDEKLARSQHGLMRALINNMVIGVTKGFEKKLQINGVGFRLTSQGPQDIEMALGFSHPCPLPCPGRHNHHHQ